MKPGKTLLPLSLAGFMAVAGCGRNESEPKPEAPSNLRIAVTVDDAGGTRTRIQREVGDKEMRNAMIALLDAKGFEAQQKAGLDLHTLQSQRQFGGRQAYAATTVAVMDDVIAREGANSKIGNFLASLKLSMPGGNAPAPR